MEISGTNFLIFRPNKHKIFACRACSDAVHRRLRRKKCNLFTFSPKTEQIQNFSEQMRPSQQGENCLNCEHFYAIRSNFYYFSHFARQQELSVCGHAVLGPVGANNFEISMIIPKEFSNSLFHISGEEWVRRYVMTLLFPAFAWFNYYQMESKQNPIVGPHTHP